MTEEPYRWLEAIANRRDYVLNQLKGGSPVLAASLPDGILLVGVGSGQSKVFEVFDRHGLAALGHPADLERIRQTAIDAAHLEAFTRAPEDVSLRRLVAFGLGPQIKTAFEQIFSPPYLVRVLLAELGATPDHDVLARLAYDGGFDLRPGGCLVASDDPDHESVAEAWLSAQLTGATRREEAVERLLECWWCLRNHQPPGDPEAPRAWPAAVARQTVEIGWLSRRGTSRQCFSFLPHPRPS